MLYPYVVCYRLEGSDESDEWESFKTYAEANACADRIFGTDQWTGGVKVTAAWVVNTNE
jgi:hypothetical protein